MFKVLDFKLLGLLRTVRSDNSILLSFTKLLLKIEYREKLLIEIYLKIKLHGSK